MRSPAGPDGVALNLTTAVGIYSLSFAKIGIFCSLKFMIWWFIPFVFSLSRFHLFI